MSSRNGDKSRFGRQRKQKIARRLELRALRATRPAAPAVSAEPAPPAEPPPAHMEQPQASE